MKNLGLLTGMSNERNLAVLEAAKILAGAKDKAPQNNKELMSKKRAEVQKIHRVFAKMQKSAFDKAYKKFLSKKLNSFLDLGHLNVKEGFSLIEHNQAREMVLENKNFVSVNRNRVMSSIVSNEDISLTQGLEIGVKGKKLFSFFRIQASPGSALLRAVGSENGVMGDLNMALVGKVCNRLLSVKLGKSLMQNDNKHYVKAVFKEIAEGIYVIHNVDTGLSRKVERKDMLNLSKNELGYKYQFLGITPSGLRTGTVSLLGTEKFLMGGNSITMDDRIEILDKTLAGAFSANFLVKDESGKVTFKEGNKEQIFKGLTRCLLGSPASSELFTAKNYFLIDNIAKNASYINEEGKPIDCSSTQDGASAVAIEKVKEALNEGEFTFSYADIAGEAMQLRGGSAKKSAIMRSRQDMRTLLIEVLIRRGVEIKKSGLYSDLSDIEAGLKDAALNQNGKNAILVLDGIVYRGKEITVELLSSVMEKIEILADFNAYKLQNFNGEFVVTCLKQAHLSESKLSMVINNIMMEIDPENTSRIILERTKKEIIKAFEDLGIVCEVDKEGSLVSIAFNNKKEEITNDKQLANFICKLNPKKMAAIMPQISKSLISSTMKRIKKLVTNLNPQINSFYTVVQSDPAVLFGERVLYKGEIHCNNFEGERVSGVRHPIGSKLAVTTFNKISTEEILKRIETLKVSDYAKDFLKNHYVTANGFATIYASHDLMEKHDGMDFDIDAMQLIVDADIVRILSKVDDVSVIINRERDKKLNISINFSGAEREIEAFKKGVSRLSSEYPEEKAEEVKALNNSSALTGVKVNSKTNAAGRYNMSFDCVSEVVCDYFTNPIASVGVIATGFYNNHLILNWLLNESVADNLKNRVALAFAYEYGCNKRTGANYVSVLTPFETKEGNKAIALNKETCCKMVYNFAASKGRIEDLVAFLDDCCKANRYAAETSIDAAKNMFKILDMFNHGYFIKGIGSDKNSTFELIDNESEFKSRVIRLNKDLGTEFSLKNTFGLSLPSFCYEGSNIEDISSKEELLEIIKSNKLERAEGKAESFIAVFDKMAALKAELVDFASDFAVLAVKLIESEALSSEAVAIRKTTIEEVSKITSNGKIHPGSKLDGLAALAISVMKGIGFSEDFDEQNSNLYKKTKALQILKNTAALMFEEFTNLELGAIVLGYIASKFQDSIDNDLKVVNVNRNLLEIFDEHILNYLSSEFGFDTRAGERIDCVQEGVKLLKDLSSLEGMEVTFQKGFAVVDNIVMASTNKRLSVTGVIKVVDNVAYVMFNRQTVEHDKSQGVYLSVNTKGENATGVTKGNVEASSFTNLKFVKELKRKNSKVKYNKIIGTLVNTNTKYEICTLYADKNLASKLAKVTDARFAIHSCENNAFVHVQSEELMVATKEKTNEVKASTSEDIMALFAGKEVDWSSSFSSKESSEAKLQAAYSEVNFDEAALEAAFGIAEFDEEIAKDQWGF